MLNLIKNETVKLLHHRLWWISIGASVIFMLLIQLLPVIMPQDFSNRIDTNEEQVERIEERAGELEKEDPVLAAYEKKKLEIKSYEAVGRFPAIGQAGYEAEALYLAYHEFYQDKETFEKLMGFVNQRDYHGFYSWVATEYFKDCEENTREASYREVYAWLAAQKGNRNRTDYEKEAKSCWISAIEAGKDQAFAKTLLEDCHGYYIINKRNDETVFSEWDDDFPLFKTGVYQSYNITSPFWKSVRNAGSVQFLLNILFILIAAGLIAEEHQDQTMKTLLVHSVKRNTIYFSKLFTLILWMAILQLFMFGLSLFIGLLVEHEGMAAKLILFENGQIILKPAIVLVGKIVLNSFVSSVFYAVLAFTIGTVSGNVIIGMVVPLVFYFFGALICAMPVLQNIGANRLLIYPNIYLMQIAEKIGDTNIAHLTLSHAIGIVLLHLILLIWISRDSLVKRDVK